MERYLLRADLRGYSYREILEVRPGSLRLLHPSERARRLSRCTSTLFALGYLFVLGYFIGAVGSFIGAGNAGGSIVSGIVGLVIAAGLIAFFFAGLVLLLLWWDDRSLPILAENPDAARPVEALGVTSFGTFQEIRARADGQELRIAVHASKGRFAEVLRFAGIPNLQA